MRFLCCPHVDDLALSTMGDAEEAKALAAEEAAIEMFKVKKLIKSLERARG